MKFETNKTETDNQVAMPKENNQIVYKKLVRIDHCTWVDLTKIIGAEINYKKRGNREFYEVILGYISKETEYGEDFNSSFEGVIPWIEFDTYDEAKQYLKDLGIELETNEYFKFNKNVWSYREKVSKYKLENINKGENYEKSIDETNNGSSL